MQHIVKTLAGTWYTISCTQAAIVTENIQGETAELASLPASGVEPFRVTGNQITVETDGKFEVLPFY